MTKKVKNKKIYIIFLSIFLVLYFAIKYSAPYLTAPLIQDLVNEKFQKQISSRNIAFEPLGLVFKINNLNLSENTSLESLYINLSFPNLVKKRLTISKITLAGLKVKISQNGESFEIDEINQTQEVETNKENKASNQNDWGVVIKEIKITKSEVLLPENYLVKINEARIFNLNPNNKESATFKAKITFLDSDVNLEGNIMDLSTSPLLGVNFEVAEFKLGSLPVNGQIGKLSGKLSAAGNAQISSEKTSVTLNSKITDLFIYSADLKMIDYFAKEIDLQNIEIENQDKILAIKSAAINIQNLLLSINENEFSEEKLSSFSKVEISSIAFEKNLESNLLAGKINFINGGNIQIKQQEFKDKKDLEVKITDLDLSQFAWSFESKLGYQIESGRLSIDAKTTFQNEKNKGDATVRFSHFVLDGENEFGQNIANPLIPLNKAVDIVKDDNNEIAFKVKIDDDSKYPITSIFDIISKNLTPIILSKAKTMAITKVATDYAPTLLASLPVSPTNAIFIANNAYQIITKPRFDDIIFENGSNKISEKSLPELEEFIKFLIDNKEVKFLVCPSAPIAKEKENEKEALKKVIFLAYERIVTLREFFKEKLDNHLGQIVFCRPKISNDIEDVDLVVIEK